jgi:hypothetical protein
MHKLYCIGYHDSTVQTKFFRGKTCKVIMDIDLRVRLRPAVDSWQFILCVGLKVLPYYAAFSFLSSLSLRKQIPLHPNISDYSVPRAQP